MKSMHRAMTQAYVVCLGNHRCRQVLLCYTRSTPPAKLRSDGYRRPLYLVTVEFFSDGGDEAWLFEGTVTASPTGTFFFCAASRLTGPNLKAIATD